MMGGMPLLLAIATSTRPVYAAEVSGLDFDPATSQLEMLLPAGTVPRYFLLAQPARIVLDVPNADFATAIAPQIYSGAVREVRVSEFEPGTTRIVLELAPDSELAPEQVRLQQVGDRTAAGQMRWQIQPLFATEAPVERAATLATIPDSAVGTAAEPPLDLTSAADVPSNGDMEGAIAPSTSDSLPVPQLPQLQTLDPVALDSTPAFTESATDSPMAAAAVGGDALLLQPNASNAPATSVGLSSLEPGAVEIPVEVAQFSSPAPLPPPILQPGVAPSVTVPPPILGAPTPDIVPQQAQSLPTVPIPGRVPTVPPPGTPVPSSSPTGFPTGFSTNPNALLPQGTRLVLRYPGTVPLPLKGRQPFQDVLIVASPVFNSFGQQVIPVGSEVLGQFETNSRGTRFVAQAVALSGRNVLLRAESPRLSGGGQVSTDRLIRNSAFGAAGVTVLGALTGGIGLLGVLAGAAGGAAATVLTGVEPATIQPGQIIEVQLTEDLLRFF
jgi:hypothetical protein